MSRSRYLDHDHRPPEDVDALAHDISSALVANVAVVQRNARSHTTSGAGGRVYVGTAGAALMNIRLADLDIRQLPPSGLLRNADTHLVTALSLGRFNESSSSLSSAKCAFIETNVGIATLVLHRTLQTSRVESQDHASDPSGFAENWRECAALLQTIVRQAGRTSSPTVSRDDGDCEVLYGRAGLLYALLFLRSSLASKPAAEASPDVLSAITNLVSDTNILQLVNAIVLRGKTGSALYRSEYSRENIPALMWSWHGKRYLGAAHGIAGILHILLLCPAKIVSPHIQPILHTVEWLVDLQDSEGNWPLRSGRHKEVNDLIHWCHGATGMLILLSTVLRRIQMPIDPDNADFNMLNTVLREKINACIARGASLVYTRGFLRKGVGICHGVGGSIYALLAVADAQPENEALYIQRAAHLAQLATHYRSLTKQGEMSIPDRPWSLYEGLAGMCCAWGDVLKRMKMTGNVSKESTGCGMPGFDDVMSENWEQPSIICK